MLIATGLCFISNMYAMNPDVNSYTLGAFGQKTDAVLVVYYQQTKDLYRQVDAGVNFAVTHRTGTTPLMVAVMSGDVEQLRAIVHSESAMVNAKDEDGNTALHFAVMGGQWTKAFILIKEGRASVYVKNHEGKTALQVVSKQGVSLVSAVTTCNDQDVCECLRIQGVFDSQDNSFGDILLDACLVGSLVKVRQLCSRSDILAFINHTNCFGETALHIVANVDVHANEDALKIMHTLIIAGANRNIVCNGETPVNVTARVIASQRLDSVGLNIYYQMGLLLAA